MIICDHDFELIDYRAETSWPQYGQVEAKYTYERCRDCGTRRLEAEGQPTYLITDDSIAAAT